MSGPRFRLVQGKALGERSTPPTGVSRTPEPTIAPPLPFIKQEAEYNDHQMVSEPIENHPISPPQRIKGGASQLPHLQMQQQRALPPMHQYQSQSPMPPPQSQPQANPNVSSEDSKNMTKCVRFLKTLIDLSNNDDPDMPDKANRVRSLIQGVIYMETTAEEFTGNLQQVLKSQAQPHLLPFLKNTLPALRNAVRNGRATVEGVSAPPGYVFNNGRAPPPQQMEMRPLPPQPSQQGPQNIINRLNGEPQMIPSPHMVQGPGSQGSRPMIQQRPLQVPMTGSMGVQGPIQRTVSGGPMCPMGSQGPPVHQMHPQSSQSIQSSQALHQVPQNQHQGPQIPPQTMQQQQQQPPPPPSQMPESQMEVDHQPETIPTRPYAEGSLKSSILKPDEVLNRITKRMMSSCSVEEEALVAISDAVESHLRELITLMTGVAEHRVESMRVPESYVPIDDVKRQLRFLEDLDRQDEELRETREKDALYRMSKNKNSGKETIEKAKEMQRQDAEAKRNRDANAAAIAALSSNKTVKNKWESSGTTSTAPRPRTVRVTTRDLHVLVNQDKRFVGTFIRERMSYGGPVIDTSI